MTDLETLLRKELAELADAVPPTADPWRAHRRRIARRRTVLAGAAVVVVAAAVPVPVALRHPRAQPPPAAVTTVPVTTTTAASPVTSAGALLLARSNGAEAWVYSTGERGVCVAVTKAGATIDPGTAVCAPDVADDAGGHSPVRTRAIGPENGQFGHVLLFIGDPGVHDLTVRRGDGAAAAVNLVGLTPQRQFWTADFHGSHQGFGYSGIDAHGEHFEAIT
jgi:hypothetical protein